MGRIIDDDPDMSLSCFRDFVAGYTIREIAKRHDVGTSTAEERIRRGLYDFGFSDFVLDRVERDRAG
ncbi:MAG: hypothetical protein IAI50_16145 [Candidatus Eremiobacteraeota bacterium]|nr:hypothetical protein [Candidatus Eremiobacteraeota bacterium]